MRTIFRRQLYPPKFHRPAHKGRRYDKLGDYEHTAQRVKTRYHLDLTREDYNKLIELIRAGQTRGRRIHRDRSKHLVTLGMKSLIVIYSRNLGRITTAFPPKPSFRD